MIVPDHRLPIRDLVTVLGALDWRLGHLTAVVRPWLRGFQDGLALGALALALRLGWAGGEGVANYFGL